MFKCPWSDEYYSKIGVSKLATPFFAVSKTCTEDPRNYQSCGLATENTIINSGILCNAAICQVEAYNLTYSHQLQQECFDITFSQSISKCKPNLDYFSCKFFIDKISVDSMYTLVECDTVCQNVQNCIDEAVCNGFTYGLFCSRNGERHYVMPALICNYETDCDDMSDELYCHYYDSHCVTANSAGIFRLRNETRCGALHLNSSGKKQSNCIEFADQFNCSDPSRGVLRCDVNGYPSTVSLAVLCMEGVKLCDDGMDTQCKKTSPSCFLHKHLLCDGVEDCEDASDEHASVCGSVIESKCYRR